MEHNAFPNKGLGAALMQSSRARHHHSGLFLAVNEEGITSSPSLPLPWGIKGELPACILPRAASDIPSKPRGCLPWSPGPHLHSVPIPAAALPPRLSSPPQMNAHFHPVFINEVGV